MGAPVSKTVFFLCLFTLVLSNRVLAQCKLDDFDKAPPVAIRDTVRNQFAHFDWASDADAELHREQC
jgi:hypothetical protein